MLSGFLDHFHLNYDMLGVMSILIGIVFLYVRGKLPSVDGFERFVHVLDSISLPFQVWTST